MTETDLDFDDGPCWLPDIYDHLAPKLPNDIGQRIASRNPEGPISARLALAERVDQRTIVDSVRDWILKRDVLVYHGTRINEAQRASIEREGLRLLVPSERGPAIAEFLKLHPRWPELAPRVPEAIDQVSRHGGGRAGTVHALLSRSGLVRGCNHYLVEGSEFEHQIANYLLGEECHEENRRRGYGALVRIRVTGASALAAANPHGETGNEPNLIAELIRALAWWLATGDNDTESFEVGCALIFYAPVPASQIEAIIHVPDEELWPHYDHRLR